MAKEIDLLCLANSRRDGGRCIAGIDLKSGKWVRPVKSDSSPFTMSEVSYKNDTSPNVLDKIKIRVLRSKASYYHPEDCIVDQRFRWERIGGCKRKNISQYVDATAPYLFKDSNDRLLARDLENQPLSKSLMLVRLPSVTFRKMWGQNKYRPQIRALFKHRGFEYNLVVTDDAWEGKFAKRDGPYWDMGDYTFNDTFYLTIGMGEKFGSYHYKLVVAVITDTTA